jgi:RNA polymerase sigma-70 factor (ECF subfamily)
MYPSSQAIRQNLLNQLAAPAEAGTWRPLFDCHWRVIYGVARRADLTDTEAQEVVKQTVLSAANHLPELPRHPAPRKIWLRQLTYWRITEQWRRRPAENSADHAPSPKQIEAFWEEEWRRNLFATALDEVKARVKPKDFQIFELLVVRQWPIAKVSRALAVNLGQVYLAKHRLSLALRKQLKIIERRWNG